MQHAQSTAYSNRWTYCLLERAAVGPCNAPMPFSGGAPKSSGVQIDPLFCAWLVLLDRDAVGIGVGVLAYAGHLPGNLASGRATGDLEMIVGYFIRDIKIWTWRPDGCELIAEVAVQGAEPVRQCDHSLALAIESNHAIVDIHHVGALDEGVVEVFVGRIERMIDHKRPSSLGKRAQHMHVPARIHGHMTNVVYSKAHVSARGHVKESMDTVAYKGIARTSNGPEIKGADTQAQKTRRTTNIAYEQSTGICHRVKITLPNISNVVE